MKTPWFIAALVVAIPLSSLAAESDVMSDDEMLTACAEALPQQKECKAEFCTSMVDMRSKSDPRFKGADAAKLKEMKETCLKEIENDGSGDLAARKKRCSDWTAQRGKMTLKRTDHSEMQACWKKAACGERIACWGPVFGRVMAANMAAKAEAQKAAPVKK